MSARTFTYTWTQTRLETIQDQFRYLLTYAGISGVDIDKIVHGVSQKVVQGVGVFGYDGTGLRVIEVELRVDWAVNAELTLSIPSITSGLSGWDDKQAPEVRVAGRRFADTAGRLGLSTNYWVAFIPSVTENSTLYADWKREMNLGGTTPGWKSSPAERNEAFLDLPEASVFIRRASED